MKREHTDGWAKIAYLAPGQRAGSGAIIIRGHEHEFDEVGIKEVSCFGALPMRWDAAAKHILRRGTEELRSICYCGSAMAVTPNAEIIAIFDANVGHVALNDHAPIMPTGT